MTGKFGKNLDRKKAFLDKSVLVCVNLLNYFKCYFEEEVFVRQFQVWPWFTLWKPSGAANYC